MKSLHPGILDDFNNIHVPVSVEPKFCYLINCFHIWMYLTTEKKAVAFDMLFNKYKMLFQYFLF